jgi:hypothetical protein
MAGLETIAMIAGLAGTAASAAGTLAAGAARKDAADFQAQQLERQAAEERAASQREADQADKERDFILSRQQVVASSSNLGALDETVLDLSGDVAQEASLKRGMIRYGGEERAKGRMAQAAAARLEGEAEKKGSYFAAAGTIASGIGSFADAYIKRRNPMQSSGYSGRYAYG